MDIGIRVLELKKHIESLRSEIAFINSACAIILQEQKMLDRDLSIYCNRAEDVKAKLRDLKAELADTI